MPKARQQSPTGIAAKAPEDIQLKPDLVDALTAQLSSGGRKKQQALWEKFANDLGCSVDTLKEALSARKNGEVKKAKEPSETRPRSARSSSIEPREPRRSLRSRSIDKTSVTSTTALESTDNSCASSVCGSPRSENKRQQQQQQRRNLCAINEDDINLESTATASSADSTQQREKVRIDDNQAEPKQESVSGTDTQSQPTTNDVHEAEVHGTLSSTSSALTRYLESAAANEIKQTRTLPTLRFSEPVQTPRNSQTALTGLSSTSRRLSTSSSNKGLKINMPNPDESTRMFFDSIGLTVMSFPQHLQASVKAQVSSIVHELEYELCSPLTEKSVTTVSVGS